MKAFFWGVFMLVILAGFKLWPVEDALWLVKFPSTTNPHNALVKVSLIKANIVDIVDNDTLVLNPVKGLNPMDLYNIGALYVVNVAAAYGCTGTIDRKDFIKLERKSYGDDS